jgi:hypothetical protein
VERPQNYSFDLPKLFPNAAWTCPKRNKEIFECLEVEATGGSQSGSENLVVFDLKLVRTAKINRNKYWLWSFKAEEGLPCNLAVQVDENGRDILGFDETFGLTPGQWLVMDWGTDQGPGAHSRLGNPASLQSC